MSPDECRRTLGVDRHASPDDLKRSKKRLLLQYHPDQNPSRREWADEQTKRVLMAYDLLLASATASAPRDVGSAGTWRSGPASHPSSSRPEPRQTHKDLHYVIVRIASALIGLPVSQVLQVMRFDHTEVVPSIGGAGRLAAGWVPYGKSRVPLLDMGAALGYGTTGLESCRHFVVLRAGTGEVAVPVGQVEQQLATINASAIEPPTQFRSARSGALKGIFHWNSGCVAVPDLDAILC
jgi:chemotaxis signal transduction protein